MKIRLAEIPDGGFKIDEDKDQSWLKNQFKERDFDLYEPTSSVNLNLRIRRFKNRVTVKGKIITSVSFTCSRCTKEGKMPVKVNVNEAFLPENKLAVPDQHTLDLDFKDFKNYSYSEDEIDLGDYIAESIMLTLPVFPKCDSETCKSGSVDYIEDWEVTEDDYKKADVNPAWQEGLGRVQNMFGAKKSKK